jgi:2-oxoisovalerate dehydrogenase E1 component
VIFVIENNQYGLSTPIAEQYACAHLADRGVGYGMPGVRCDGNDLLAVVRIVREAAARARQGDGPTLIEFETFRMRGHEEASGTDYVPAALFEEWASKDPILRFERIAAERGVWAPGELDAERRAMVDEIDRLADLVLAESDPTSTVEIETADVYALPKPLAVRSAAGPSRERRYLDAITDGLREAMRADDRVVLLGQDIAEYGGAFKVTEGLVTEFGRARVRNTPIIESGAIGAALGLALEGFRPMVEMQFGDFISCGFNQVVNNLAKTHYRWGEGVPVVLRVPVGGGAGAGPFHSQNVEAWFTQAPGLKVVAPATPADAKGLLLAAFEDGNPVLFLEHKLLYRSIKGLVPDGFATEPIGRARVARAGRDATAVTWGVGVHWALDAATGLAAEGRELEVIDLRSLLPWDVETVLASVRRTGRALVLHEAPLTGGFGGEVAATIGHDAFEWLDAPVARLAALDTPVPFSRALEDLFSPRVRVSAVLRELLAY